METLASPFSFPVAEHFVSINGEGVRAGRLAAFVRFRGCPLACSYCDTAWANEPDCPVQAMTVADIVSFADGSGARCVTLTGGEPLAQPGVGALIEALLAHPDRLVEIETNGAVSLQPFAELRRRVRGAAPQRLAFTMDCKLPSSGMHDEMLPRNYLLLEPHDTVKFVIGDEGDFTAAAREIHRRKLQERCHVYLSPVYGRMDPARIVDFMRREGLDRATLQLQLHKLIWPARDRGV